MLFVLFFSVSRSIVPHVSTCVAGTEQDEATQSPMHHSKTGAVTTGSTKAIEIPLRANAAYETATGKDAKHDRTITTGSAGIAGIELRTNAAYETAMGKVATYNRAITSAGPAGTAGIELRANAAYETTTGKGNLEVAAHKDYEN